MTVLIFLLLMVAAYLLGSIPSSVWIGKAFYNVDVRKHGSGNAGATNTIRVLGLRAGLIVFVIDVLKGVAAVLLARLMPEFFCPYWSFTLTEITLGVCVFLGHLFPIFAGFRGGKGVATLCGVVLVILPWAALCALGVFFIVLLITRYVSLGSIAAALSFPIFELIIYGWRSITLFVFSFVLACMLLLTHRVNIKRLRTGTESKFRPTKRGSSSGKSHNQ